MELQNKYKRIPLDKIFVDRDNRQRKEFTTDDIEPSIKQVGVIQPIIVEPMADGRYKLHVGERRFTASCRLGLPDIPARFVSDLSPIEAHFIELEENIKRLDLDWKDYCTSVTEHHELHVAIEPTWTQGQTAEVLNIHSANLSMILKVTEALRANNPLAVNAAGYRPAYNQIARREERAMDDAMNDLLAEPPPVVADFSKIPGGAAAVAESMKTSGGVINVVAEPHRALTVVPPQDDILNTSFLEWAPQYSGLPFSFIHMDFPYGVNLGESAQANSKAWGGYSDKPDDYWTLLNCLADNQDRLFTTSAHFMFWFSMDFYTETLGFFRDRMSDFNVQVFPLYWHKTDNKGILPDPNRGPRRIVETCLIGSRGDRYIVKPVSNCYGSPTTKEIHQSEKPEPMLRHFFQMFVDNNTRMLDPTCGSGTSLRAAESLGATTVRGLEINSEWAAAARVALRKFRTLRAISERKS